MAEHEINERAQRILTALVARYIRDGQPVGSKTMALDSAMSLSPATIRNIMSDLEHAGYICSPHTSAGRLPTAKGYRFYADSLLNADISRITDVEDVRRHLTQDGSEQDLLGSVSSLLSTFTHLAGVVSIPRRDRYRLRYVEFLPLDKRRILVILVFNDHEVQNRIIHTERDYAPNELTQAANYLMMHFVGMDMVDIRQGLMQKLADDRKEMEQYLSVVLEVAEQAFEPNTDKDFVMAGEANLFNIAENSGIDHLRSLFETFTQRHAMLHLLDQCLQSDGVQIFIGQESGVQIFDGCSFVAAPYAIDDQTLGVLGVIGPTRMDYERVISTVDVTAKLLSTVLRDVR